MKPQRIAIIGAGTAGLAAANYLSRQEHDVHLFERAAALRPVGAGLLLQPSGVRVLDELGCLEAMNRWGARIDGLFGETAKGAKLMQVRYTDLASAEDLYGIGVHRATLCGVLAQSLSLTPHRLHFGCEIGKIEEGADAVTVQFTDRGKATAESFDAVLIANGSNSALRPPEWVKYDRAYPWGAMWQIESMALLPENFRQPHLRQRYAGSSIMVGVLPTGRIPDQAEDLFSFFWSLPVSQIAQWREDGAGLDRWKSELLDVWPELAPYVATIARRQDFLPATYRDVIMRRWGQGRVGVLGDAAHAMSPQLGQGASLALQDAQAFAVAVQNHRDWNDVWRHYHALRAGSIRFYQRMSRWLTPLYQSNVPGAAPWRDFSFPLAHRIPYFRKNMASTVAGFKQGWLR